MMTQGLEFTGTEPFKDVLIHGIIRDSLGRKMSKTLGNGVDPLEVIDEYGADALRFSVISGTTMGHPHSLPHPLPFREGTTQPI